MFRKIGEALRVSAFFLIALSIWAIWSVNPFFSNNPTDFQAAGSIIVAWAIFFYGRDRLFRENAINASHKALFVAAYNSVNARLAFHQSLAENTQNMNSLAYAKLLKMLGIKDQDLGDNDDAIEDLERSLQETEQHYQLGQNSRDADVELERQLSLSDETELVQGKWTRILYVVELAMVVFGTIQWGYGDRWVVATHNAFPELSMWWTNLL